MKVIQHLTLPTVNRGEKEFIISQTDKGFFAHELGDLTQWAKVFGGGEQKAHRLNPNRRIGNQYIRSWRPRPFKTIDRAISSIHEHANTSVQYF